MENKMKLGADGIEIQLLGELIKNDGSIKNLEDAFPNLKEFLRFPVYSVHAPLCCYTDGIDIPPNIEVLAQNKFLWLYKEVCRLANMYGEKYNRLTKVVLHTEIDFSRSDIVNVDTLNKIIKITKMMLRMFPYIDICIENVLPIRVISPNGECVLGAGFGFDNVTLCEKLRTALPEHKERLHTVYDTCHGEVAYKTMKFLEEYNPNVKAKNYTCEEFFKRNAQTCGLIHLSKTVGNGMGKGNHGQPFKEGDEDICFDYMRRYKELNYTCPVVLEVAETNYDISDGFKTSNTVLRNTLNNLVV